MVEEKKRRGGGGQGGGGRGLAFAIPFIFFYIKEN
jgi:hypothetical protein